ncbi:MAG TPA: UDP-N-acetylmuramate--L-alanine ligase [Phycisphaerae bacterium]|nr:UDP-N-acetylmuramate--L-alanine ligase [Phycisphaerae bacterium]
MSEVIPTTDAGLERITMLTPRRARPEHRQHWSSPYAAKRIHLIGAGGCGMSGLAGVLLRCGAIVSGSDQVWAKTFDRLEEMGATLTLGHAPMSIPTDCEFVVYSAAIKDENPELKEARRRGITCLKYAEMLGRVMALRTGIAIAGTHGKSTTTALLAFILRQANVDPTFVVGAESRQLGGGSGVGDGPHFLVEACEYDRSFWNYHPQHAAILNIEEDHLDCYKDLDAIIEAFNGFASRVAPSGTIVIHGEDPVVARAVRDVRAKVETFGLHDGANWRAVNLANSRGHYSFDIQRDGEFHLHADLENLPGRHQVGNALVAAALAHHAGIKPAAVAEALTRFAGADRRISTRGEVGGVILVDDYGHHPTEIQVTLHAVRERYPDRRLWVIFQPHQHSRTRFLLDDFAASFGQADRLLVPDIYFVRDSEKERNSISSRHLVERVQANGGNALYLPSHDQIVEHIVDHIQSGDVVLTMGAGDVWKISDELVRRLAR